MSKRLTIVIEPDADQFHAYVPAFKGLHVGGSTEVEALRHSLDAIDAYVKSLLRHGEAIPFDDAAKEDETTPCLRFA